MDTAAPNPEYLNNGRHCQMAADHQHGSDDCLLLTSAVPTQGEAMPQEVHSDQWRVTHEVGFKLFLVFLCAVEEQDPPPPSPPSQHPALVCPFQDLFGLWSSAALHSTLTGTVGGSATWRQRILSGPDIVRDWAFDVLWWEGFCLEGEEDNNPEELLSLSMVRWLRAGVEWGGESSGYVEWPEPRNWKKELYTHTLLNIYIYTQPTHVDIHM